MAYKFKDGSTYHIEGDLVNLSEDINYPPCKESCDMFTRFIETDHQKIEILTKISSLQNKKVILGVRFQDIFNSIKLNVFISFDILKLKIKLWK